MTLNEFLNNKIDELMKLGIDKRFLENPIFGHAIKSMTESILEGPIDANKDQIKVTKKDKEINIRWDELKDNSKIEHRYKIESKSPDSLQLIKAMTSESYTEENKLEKESFTASEKIIKLCSDNKIEITDSHATAKKITDSNSIKENPHLKTDLLVNTEKKYYSPNGVMIESIEKTYKRPTTLDLEISTSGAATHVFLSPARHDEPNYNEIIHIKRDKIDTAEYKKIDKTNGIEYNAILPLDTTQSLRNMTIAQGYENCPENVVIAPLSQEEIETLIAKENNPIIREGLKDYATNRDTYSYNSRTDVKFVRTGFITKIIPLNEILNNITEELMNLGLNKRFLENPAFSSAIKKIVENILEGPIKNNVQSINTIRMNNTITFQWIEWKNNIKHEYNFEISSKNPETVSLIKSINIGEHIDEKGKIKKELDAFEISVKIDEYNRIIIADNYANVQNIIDNPNINRNSQLKYEGISTGEKSIYSPYGIMVEKRENKYKLELLNPNNLTLSALHKAHNEEPNYYYTHLMTRDKLDTARCIEIDKVNQTEYRATLPLHTEHNLRDMNIESGYSQNPEEVVIEPLSHEIVEKLITRENNPKIEEGLRNYAKNRDTYTYDSKIDKNFVRKGFEKDRTLS